MEQECEQVRVLWSFYGHTSGESFSLLGLLVLPRSGHQKMFYFAAPQQSKFRASSKQTLFTGFDLSYNDSEHV